MSARADELAGQFVNCDPADDDRGEPPLLALQRLAYRRMLLDRELTEAVRAARDAGLRGAQVGHRLGTSGEAARRRYSSRLRPDQS
jgi:hypothetical protein